MKAFLVLGLALLVAGVLFVLFGTRPLAAMNTNYPAKFVKQKFKTLQKGASIDAVYTTLGPPLYLDVNPDRFGSGAYKQIRDYDVGIDHVRGLMRNTNVELYLTYSRPKTRWGHYLLYYVDLREGVVFRINGGDEMD